MKSGSSDDTTGDDPVGVDEWRIVPTIPHPDPDVDESYTSSPGPVSGLTEQRAKELARGRNRAGEPSPQVTWEPEPTGKNSRISELQQQIDTA